MKQDEEHLRLLSIFHYVLAVLVGLSTLCPFIYFVIGLVFILAPHQFSSNGQPPPPIFLGWIFVFFALIFITFGLVLAALLVTTGRFLAQHRHHTFCLVMAGIECIFMPFGTILGVLTIMVLIRESTKPLFEPGSMPPLVK
jgi:hypothetical protein